MISAIGLRNFKCFERLYLNIKPLSLLCGPNGMGKSSVIQALLVLRQSYISGELTLGRLVLGGDLADLGTGADLLFEDAAEDLLGFELEWIDNSVSRHWSMEFQYEREADRLQAVPRRRHRPPSHVPIPERRRPPFGGQFVYLNAERIGPRKTHLLSETRARSCDLGAKGEYVLNYLHSEARAPVAQADLRAKKSVPLQLGPQVDAWLQEVTRGVHIELEPIRAADAVIGGFVFDREGDVASGRYRATNVGFGLSYVLPVIVALLAATAGGLILIENPEAHLHPRGQTKLGELAARTAAGGVQVLVETHSDHFMDGVRLAVHDGIVTPAEVSFHYFDRKGASSSVESPTIDAEGRLSYWPEGFFDQHEENLARLLAPRC
jgi:predicted ATPase